MQSKRKMSNSNNFKKTRKLSDSYNSIALREKEVLSSGNYVAKSKEEKRKIKDLNYSVPDGMPLKYKCSSNGVTCKKEGVKVTYAVGEKVSQKAGECRTHKEKGRIVCKYNKGTGKTICKIANLEPTKKPPKKGR